MTKLVAISALVAALFFGMAADAGAWERHGTFTGPRGTTTTSGSGSCAGGNCSWQGGGTGPRGNSWSRQGTASCSGGTCTSSGGGTGPQGGSWSRSGTTSCSGGTCTSTGGGTGPRGGSWSRSGSFSR